MSKPSPPKRAKLITSCFTGDKDIFGDAVRKLCESFGIPDMISPWLSFDQTDYYRPEMGAPLFRRLMGFRNLIEQDALADIKLFTNDLENQLSSEGKRVINIDPGYLVPERFVLATGKNYTHRIYLRSGIYADLTLLYHKGGFRPLAWTYPDYAGEAIIDFLETARERYKCQIKHGLVLH